MLVICSLAMKRENFEYKINRSREDFQSYFIQVSTNQGSQGRKQQEQKQETIQRIVEIIKNDIEKVDFADDIQG